MHLAIVHPNIIMSCIKLLYVCVYVTLTVYSRMVLQFLNGVTINLFLEDFVEVDLICAVYRTIVIVHMT